MSFSTPTYLLNVALHAAVLSVTAWVILAGARRVSHRSAIAVAGLLAVGLLPWITSLRPVTATAGKSAGVEAPPSMMPTWTVVKMRMPVEEGAQAVVLPPSSTPLTSARVTASPRNRLPDVPNVPTLLVLAWATGVGICLLQIAVPLAKIRGWRKGLRSADEDEWRKIRSCTDGLPPRGVFLIDEAATGPCVTGLFRPRIVLPRFLLDEGAKRELRWAVRHESRHWQAGDSRWMFLFCVLRGVNWWNPLVHRLVSRWEEAREQVCDLHAAGVSDLRAEYGEFLIAMASQVTRRTPHTVTMARSGGRQLKKRIRFLLGALADADRPAGKMRLALVCGWFAAAGILISGVKIQAEETSSGRTTAAVSDGNDKPVEPLAPPRNAPVSPAPEKSATAAVPRNEPNVAVKISTEFVLSSAYRRSEEGVQAGPAEAMEDTEAANVLKILSEHPGATRVTARDISCTAGEVGKWEFYWPVAGKMGPDMGQAPFVGVKVKVTPHPEGEDLVLGISTDYRYMPGFDEPLGMILAAKGDLPPGLDPAKVKVQCRDVTARFRSGQTRCAELGQDESGRTLWMLAKVESIDAKVAAPQPPPTAPEQAKTQIKVSSKFIVADDSFSGANEPLPEDGRFPLSSLFSEHQMKTIMRGFAQKPDTWLMTSPSLFTTPGEKSVMEIIRRVPGTPEQIAARPPEAEVPFVGIHTSFTARSSGGDATDLALEIDYTVDFRFVPGIYPVGHDGEPPRDLDPSQIQALKQTFKGRMYPGMTVARKLGEVAPGKFLHVLARVQIVGSDGGPTDEPEVAQAPNSPTPQTKGRLRLSGEILELPLAEEISVGEGTPQPGVLTPCRAGIVRGIRNTPGAKIRKLKAAEIPLFERGIPWPEVPEFKVSGIASEDFKLITIASWTDNGEGEYPETSMDQAAGSHLTFGLKNPGGAVNRFLLLRIDARK